MSSLVLLLSEGMPLILSPDMDPVVAVLRSNFWLTIHVLTIVASYGILAVASVLGHVYLGKEVLFARRGTMAAPDAKRSDAIIVHDGVTPIDAGEIRSLWRRWVAQTPTSKNDAGEPATMHGQMSDLANLPAIHAAMERAHGRLIGFQMVTPLPFDEAFAELGAATGTNTLRSDSPRNAGQPGVGRIPSLPRPKFLTALANFALGE